MCTIVVLDKYGKEYNAGRIDYRNNEVDRVHLSNLFSEADFDSSFFTKNLCAKRFKKCYGAAVEKDPMLFTEGCYEWRRSVVSNGRVCGEALCNPEDVVLSSKCVHDARTVICADCSIPICNECWRYAATSQDIPKALCNDNFVGYLRRFSWSTMSHGWSRPLPVLYLAVLLRTTSKARSLTDII